MEFTRQAVLAVNSDSSPSENPHMSYCGMDLIQPLGIAQ